MYFAPLIVHALTVFVLVSVLILLFIFLSIFTESQFLNFIYHPKIKHKIL